jgi:transmembrane sensor
MHHKPTALLKRFFVKKPDKDSITSEEKLLNLLLQKVYHTATWDEKTMGGKNEIRNEIRSGIRIKPVTTLNSTFLKYAAVIAIISSLVYIFQYRSTPSSLLVTTTKNVLDSIVLNDGSLVYLAPNSSLEYPEKFKGKERNIKLLKGNAFFEVIKDPKHPFVIQSGGVKTKVLGTSFHIRLQKNNCHVAVVTGKVEVNYKNNTENLIPGEEAFTKGSLLKKETASAVMSSNWYNKDITLKEVHLSEVFNLLQLKFGVSRIDSSPEIDALELTLFIGRKAQVQEILNQINYITNLNLRYENEIITQDSN